MILLFYFIQICFIHLILLNLTVALFYFLFLFFLLNFLVYLTFVLHTVFNFLNIVLFDLLPKCRNPA